VSLDLSETTKDLPRIYRYCYHVESVSASASLHLEPTARDRAIVERAGGVQLTNILRDVKEVLRSRASLHA